MKTRGHVLGCVSTALSIVVVVAGCSDSVTSAPTTRQVRPTMSRVADPTVGRHVFVLSGNVPADFADRVAARGGSISSSMSEIGVVVTQGLSDADATALAGKDAVAPDYEAQWLPPDEAQLSADLFPAPVDMTSAKPPLRALALSLQWNMFQIHAPEAWVTKTGIPDVRVAILDTGLDPDHVDQRGLIDRAASTAFVASARNAQPAWLDDNTHGTFVGGIVTSNDSVTAGVAPNVTLIAVKVLDSLGRGFLSNLITGIYYSTVVANAHVINMSLGSAVPKNVHAPGGPTVLAAMNRVVNFAKSHGVLLVSAAGNEFTDLQHDRNFVQLPCEAGVQLCVSATGRDDTHASYSNFGTSAINVAAPGGDGPAPGSLATWIVGLCSTHTVDPRLAGCRLPNRNGHILATGTSASAPHVSGLAALLDSQFGGQLTASKMITLIEQGADDLGKPGADQFFGKGRINVFNTLNTTPP